MPNPREATVIGAGIVGICTALSLQERGIKVRLIDRSEPGSAASYGNAGIISPWSIVPLSVPGFWKNLPRWLLARDGPVRVSFPHALRVLPWAMQFLGNANEKRFRETSDAMEILCGPCIDLFKHHLNGTGHESLVADSYYVQAFRNASSARLDSLDYSLRIEKGADIELIGASELKALEPAISSDYEAAVIIKGQARARSPGRIAKVLADKARMRGAEIVQGEVQGIEKLAAGNWQISMDGNKLEAPSLVLCAGAWTHELLKGLGIKLPLVAERGYHLQFATPGVEINHSVMDVERKLVASSMVDGLRIAGTSEFAPVDAPPRQSRYASLLRSARRLLPDLNTHAPEQWMGARPALPDGLPVLGEFPGHEGLFGAFGHSHYGLMMAPKSGQLIADMVAGKTSNLDLGPFRANRFE